MSPLRAGPIFRRAALPVAIQTSRPWAGVEVEELALAGETTGFDTCDVNCNRDASGFSKRVYAPALYSLNIILSNSSLFSLLCDFCSFFAFSCLFDVYVLLLAALAAYVDLIYHSLYLSINQPVF